MSDGSVDYEEEEAEVEEEKRTEIELENAAEGEEEAFIPQKSLVQDMIPQCLSMLCKIGNGLSHAFVKLMCNDMELTDIDHIKKFIHVRYVDVSGNMIRDMSPINSLTHLLSLKADKNNLLTAELDRLPYLQIINFAYNKIPDLSGIDQPHLNRLNLNFNSIHSSHGLSGKTLSNLQTLELRGNQLDSTTGLAELTSLENLYLAGNRLTKIEGLDGLKNLQVLHIRDNQIEELDGFSEAMKKLQYINIRGNAVKKLEELKKLVSLPLLRALVLSDNPCNEEENYRIEVLILLRRLVRLDKDEFTDEDRADAEDVFNQRKQEELQEQEEEEDEDADD